MACNSCYLLDSIPECSNELTLGVIDDSTEVYIYVQNLSTGYVHRQEATSDLTGNIVLDLTSPDPSFYNADNAYEIWATLRTDNDRLLFTIGTAPNEVDYTCFNISFYQVNDTLEEA